MGNCVRRFSLVCAKIKRRPTLLAKVEGKAPSAPEFACGDLT
jgi:hypothetical protein